MTDRSSSPPPLAPPKGDSGEVTAKHQADLGRRLSMLNMLEQVSAEAVGEYLATLEQQEGPNDEALTVLELLAWDPRHAVRSDVAQLIARWPSASERLLRITATLGRDDTLRGLVAKALCNQLLHASGLQRVQIVAEWATSKHASLRSTLARALAEAPPVVGAPSTIQHLVEDRSAMVRREAARAAAHRLPQHPQFYVKVLETLLADADPDVRAAAIEAASGHTDLELIDALLGRAPH